MNVSAQQHRAEEMEEQRRTELAVQIFHLDLDQEATAYEVQDSLAHIPLPQGAGRVALLSGQHGSFQLR